MLPIVNVDAKMTSKMLDALTLLETSCAMKGINEVDSNDVKDFLAKNANKNLVNSFKEEYLYKA